MIPNPPLHFDLMATHCAWCRCFPCECARARTRTERCACGGSLTVTANDSVPAVVAAHNATVEHRAWRERR